MFVRFFSILLITCALFLVTLSVHADEIEDLQKQIDSLNRARELSVKATKPLEGQLDSLKRQLDQIQATLGTLAANIKHKQKELDIREDKLVVQQVLLEKKSQAILYPFLSDQPLNCYFVLHK